MEQRQLCLDYDGMGNYGRFPAIKNKLIKGLDMWNLFRIFVSTNGENPSKNLVS